MTSKCVVVMDPKIHNMEEVISHEVKNFSSALCFLYTAADLCHDLCGGN